MDVSDAVDAGETASFRDDPSVSGYVFLGGLVALAMSIRLELAVLVDVVGLLAAVAGVLHVHRRTMDRPPVTGGLVDERVYTTVLMGVGAFLAADYLYFRVVAYFVVAGVLANYWNGATRAATSGVDRERAGKVRSADSD